MRVVLTAENVKLVESLRQSVNGLGFECVGSDCVPFEALLLRLGQQPAPELVIVVLGADQVGALSAVQQAAAIGFSVLVAGAVSSDLRGLLTKAGVRGFLNPSKFKEDLSQVVEQLHKSGGIKARRGRAHVVLGATTGVGVSTVAGGLATALAARGAGQVLLAELGNGIPELALRWGLEVTHGVPAVVKNWERSDPYMIRQAVIEQSPGLSVLAYPAETLTPLSIEPPVMQQLMVLSRAVFDHVIVDLGQGVGPSALQAMALAEAVYVVLLPEVPALRMTRALLKKLLGDVPADRIHLLVNRTGWRQQLDVREIEKVVGQAVEESIPDDPATVIVAHNEGQPTLATSRRARMNRCFDRLAGKLLPAAR